MILTSVFGFIFLTFLPSFNCFNAMRRIRLTSALLKGFNYRLLSKGHSLIKASQTAVEVDRSAGVTDLAAFDLPTNDNSPELLRIRHTSAHVMAMAVQKLFPEAQVTIGPWVESG